MKAEFTVYPTGKGKLVFTVEAPAPELKWLENVLVQGTVGAIIRRDIPYQPEPDAPWPTGPLLEDM